MAASAVEAEGLGRHFALTKAVEGLDFSVKRGELFCIVGPDGAGKTTTIRMLAGILRPTTGRARILGFDLIRESGKIKDRIGYLSQKFTLYGDLTVDENIEFFAGIHHLQSFEKRREELLGFTRLAPFRRRLADHLSGGMRQKLALACTLIHTPDLLLLDEPTTGVDPVSRRDFWKILFRLLEEGITIIMTTPYLDEAERGSRVALMHRGRFVVVDAPEKVKGLMKGIVIELICDENRKASAVLRAAAEVVEVQAFGDRLHLVVGDGEKDMAAVRSRLEAEKIRIFSSRRIPASLENVFIALIRDSSDGSRHD